jgi:hypothetical protein
MQDRGALSNLTLEEVQWAREMGATTDDEVLDMIAKHEAFEQGQ